MSLKDKLLEDMKLAMKGKDTLKKNAVQMVRAAVLQIEKDEKVILNDEQILEVIAKEMKKRRDALVIFEKSDRQDLIDNLKAEIEILTTYLPPQLNEQEIEEIVLKAINDCGAASAKDMGKVMQMVMPNVKGRADGKIINQIVKKYLC